METQSPALTSPPARGPVASRPGLADVAVLLARREPGGPGGLAGLEAAFVREGLGERFASWVGTGPNVPVSGAELARVLGPALQSMADAAGTDRGRLADGLAELLPRVVDGLTPAGRLPTRGLLGSGWALARLLLARPRRAAP